MLSIKIGCVEIRYSLIMKCSSVVVEAGDERARSDFLCVRRQPMLRPRSRRNQ